MFSAVPGHLSLFILLLLTLNIEVLHLQYILVFCAYRAGLLRHVIFKALQMLLMCVYPAEQAYPKLFASSSARDTVSFVTFNEICLQGAEARVEEVSQ